MKLNLNFDGFTKLKVWWKILFENFTTIQNECTSMQNDIKKSCTKKEAQAYIDRLVNLTPEYMQAVNALNEFLGETGDITDALNEIYSERLKYFNTNEPIDADSIWDMEEDTLYFLKSEDNENVPTQTKGLLLNVSGENGYQMWIDSSGIYLRSKKTDNWNNEVQNNITDIKKEMSEAVANIYTQPIFEVRDTNGVVVYNEDITIFENNYTFDDETTGYFRLQAEDEYCVSETVSFELKKTDFYNYNVSVLKVVVTMPDFEIVDKPTYSNQSFYITIAIEDEDGFEFFTQSDGKNYGTSGVWNPEKTYTYNVPLYKTKRQTNLNWKVKYKFSFYRGNENYAYTYLNLSGVNPTIKIYRPYYYTKEGIE